jgi:hypothetical protein
MTVTLVLVALSIVGLGVARAVALDRPTRPGPVTSVSWTPTSGVSVPATSPTPTLDLAGNCVHVDQASRPDPSALPSGRGRLVVSAADLNVPLGSVRVVDGAVTPPGFRSAYLLANKGVAPAEADQGTVFVITHSVHGGGDAPGNRLITNAGTSRLRTGDAITAGGASYRVTGSRTVPKAGLAGDTRTWAAVPGRLIVITCMLGPDGGLTDRNLVVEARLVS